MRNILITTAVLFSSFSFAIPTGMIRGGGGPKPSINNLIKAELVRLDKPHYNVMTDSQKAVAHALRGFVDAHFKCELGLLSTSASEPESAAGVDSAPSWLVEAARITFIDKKDLDPASLAAIANHQFLTEVRYDFPNLPQLIDPVDLKKNINRALLDTVPVRNDVGRSLNIQLGHVQRFPLSNSLSFQLKIIYDNGETRMLQFRKVEIGSVQPSERIAQLVVAAIHHRELLSNEGYLRQEMNAIRYNLMKLLRVTSSEAEPKIASMVKSLERAQPKSGWFTSLLNGNRWLTGTDTMMGSAFWTLIRVKQDLIEMAQRAKELEVEAARKAEQAVDVDFIPNNSSVAGRGRTASGYYVPRQTSRVEVQPSAAPRAQAPRGNRRARRAQVAASSTSSANESDFMATMVWIHDPMYMLSRPWFWGAKDGSFTSHWMMYDWMQDRTRRAQEDQSRRDREIFRRDETYSEQDMRRFERPVDPVFTRNNDRPVLDPWTPEGQVAAQTSRGVIVANVDDGASVTWNLENSDRPVDIHTRSGRELEQDWNRVTGRGEDTRTVEVRDLGGASSAEAERFSTARDGSGWGQPSPEPANGSDDFRTGGTMEGGPARDSSIKSY